MQPESGDERNGEGRPARGPIAVVVSWLWPALIAVAVILPLRASVADWNDVPSGSMWPTILEGDRIFVDKLAYGLRVPFTTLWVKRWAAPQRGDVVTFASPKDGIQLVKRIVGLPGDRVSMEANRLFLNGEALHYEALDSSRTRALPDGRRLPMVIETETLADHPHAVAFTPDLVALDHFREIVVPAGHYFFLGDNRDQSYDSRFIGFAAADAIYGRATHVALSLDPDHGYRPRFERWFTALH